MKPYVKTSLPGPKSKNILDKLKRLNGNITPPYPFVISKNSLNCYIKDIDNNVFLDFSSQIASSPLGYNHSDIKSILKNIPNPIKFAGQDFTIPEHKELLEELLSITPKNLNAAFLINSGAEAVENSIKVCMRKRPKTKFGIYFEGSFHGGTLGALSLTSSKAIYTKNYLKIPTKKLPFNEEAPEKLLKIIKQSSSDKIGFIIIEPIQGEGGYNVASKKMIKKIRQITKEYDIPLVSDEVQSGMGRTGEWWAVENFNIAPDVMSAAKALQVGATIANRKKFPNEHGAISSTWGGGHLLDLIIGREIIKTIKKRNLLDNIRKQGSYLKKRLLELNILNSRGIGLMQAFDLSSVEIRNNLVVESLKNGLVGLGCGKKGIRLIPPYIIQKNQIDQAIEILDKSLKIISKKTFKHKGGICNYLECGASVS